MTSGTDESYESYMTVSACHMTCCLRAGGARRSRIALEMQRYTQFVYCASASLNASVPLGSRHGVAGPARTSVDAGGNSRHRRRRQWLGCAVAAGDGGKPPLHKRRRWPQSRTTDVGSSGSVVTPPGSTSSRLQSPEANDFCWHKNELVWNERASWKEESTIRQTCNDLVYHWRNINVPYNASDIIQQNCCP